MGRGRVQVDLPGLVHHLHVGEIGSQLQGDGAGHDFRDRSRSHLHALLALGEGHLGLDDPIDSVVDSGPGQVVRPLLVHQVAGGVDLGADGRAEAQRQQSQGQHHPEDDDEDRAPFGAAMVRLMGHCRSPAVPNTRFDLARLPMKLALTEAKTSPLL